MTTTMTETDDHRCDVARCVDTTRPDAPLRHMVTVLDTQESFACRSDESLLAGMVRLGKRGIPVGCRGGGCGVCRIEVVRGDYVRHKMSAAHVDATDLSNHRVLACRIVPAGDLEIRVLGRMAQHVCAPPATDSAG